MIPLIEERYKQTSYFVNDLFYEHAQQVVATLKIIFFLSYKPTIVLCTIGHKFKIDVLTYFYLLIEEFLRYSHFNILLLYAAPALLGTLNMLNVVTSISNVFIE